MYHKIKNIQFIFFFFIIASLVFLSRQIQINYIKKFSDKFYIFTDPILSNPDGYHFLTQIKNQLINESSIIEKLFSNDFLTLIYVILFSLFSNISLPELIMVSSPFFVLLTFVSIYFFFNSIVDKKLALLISFTSILSEVFYFRSSVLFFDTDVLIIFFYFIILFNLSLFFKKNLTSNQFYLFSIFFLLNYILFSYHYLESIFPIIYIILLVYIFLLINQKIISKFLVLLFFFLITYFFYGDVFLIDEFLRKNEVYSSIRSNDQANLITQAESVSELQILNLFELEKVLFRFNSYGLLSILSFIGINIYIKNNLSKIILFFPFLVFLYGTLTSGIRFLIYVAPFIYFGLFYIINYVSKKLLEKYKIKTELFSYFLYSVIIFFIWNFSFASCSEGFSINCKQKYSPNPYFDKNIIKGILKFNNIDEEYNIITSPDYGYLIDYYTKTKSVANGERLAVENLYSFFYSKDKPTNKKIKEKYKIKNQNENYIYFTRDFIKWWPTITKLNSTKNDKVSQIIEFDCNKIKKKELSCVSDTGIKSVINLYKGSIDKSDLIYKVIINSKKNYSESILNKDGKVIIVFTPELKHKNLYAIFPSEFENLTFIKYFFSKISNVDIDLVEDGWPYYRTYRVNR